MQKVWYKWMRDAARHPSTPCIRPTAKPATPGVVLRTRDGVVLGTYIRAGDTLRRHPEETAVWSK